MVATHQQERLRLTAEQRDRDTASAKMVFEVPELLGNILLHLHVDEDVKTVLLAQRVDRTFKATIDGSVKVQRMLWLLPDSSAGNDMELNPWADDLYVDIDGDLFSEQSMASVQRKLPAWFNLVCSLDELPVTQLFRFPKGIAAHVSKVQGWLEVIEGWMISAPDLSESIDLNSSVTVGRFGELVWEKAKATWPERFDEKGELLAWDYDKDKPTKGTSNL